MKNDIKYSIYIFYIDDYIKLTKDTYSTKEKF